jgi:HAD superfamily hydrolase (TIGR01509 family)
MTVDAIIFDFDGVIIDTETPDFETWRDVYHELGQDLTADLWTRRVGAAADNLHFDPAAHYETLTGQPMTPDVVAHQRSWYLERCGMLPILPGVMDVLNFARAHKIPLAIASNSFYDWVERYAKHVGIFDYFICICTRGDVREGKPAPDVYLKAAGCLGVPVDRCLAIEDSPTGMRAAIAAGIHVIAVPGPLTIPLPRPDGVALTLDHLSDLSPADLIARF